MQVLRVVTDHVTRVSLSGCGRWLAVAAVGPAGGGHVALWDRTTGRQGFVAGGRRAAHALVHPAGATLLTWGGGLGGLSVRPTAAPHAVRTTVAAGRVSGLAGSAAGGRLVGFVDGSLVGWTATDGHPREDWRVPLGPGRGRLAVSPDGGLVGFEWGDGFHSWRGRAELRFAGDGSPVAVVEPGGGLGMAGLLADGRALIPDDTGRLCGLEFERPWPLPPLHDDVFGDPAVTDADRFGGAAVSPCGGRVLVARGDRVELLAADTLAVERRYAFPTAGHPTCVAFAPDGLTAACGTSKGVVVIWDLD